MGKRTIQRPLSYTPMKGFEAHVIQCNPEMFTAMLNDLVALLNYTNKVAIDNYNEMLETRKKVDCVMVELQAIKDSIKDNVHTVQSYEDRLKFLEGQLGGSGGMMNNLEAKITYLESLIPMPLADIPKTWKISGGDITKLGGGR